MSLFTAHTLSKLVSYRKLYLLGFILGFSLLGSPAFAQDSFREQLKVYDRDDIHSIHKKLYTKEGRHELTLPIGGIANNEGYALLGLQYEYHLFENFGIEAANGMFGFQLGDNDRLWMYQTSLSFSPIYGKISFFTWFVANFDIYLIGGGGVVKYQGRFNGTSFAGNVGIGQRFFINEYLAFKVEFRDYIFKRNGVGTSSILNNYALTGGISMFFPFRSKY
jgi:outer membrane beta-barrel protein